VRAQAQAVAGTLLASGLDEAALGGFAVMVVESADGCVRSIRG
jgi:hypothetical protein